MPTHFFDVKMSEMTLEVRSDEGVVIVNGYPESLWQDENGARGLHLDASLSPGWLEIPFDRVITWRPNNPQYVLSYDWRHSVEGGGPTELVYFFADELMCLDRVSRGVDPWFPDEDEDEE